MKTSARLALKAASRATTGSTAPVLSPRAPAGGAGRPSAGSAEAPTTGEKAGRPSAGSAAAAPTAGAMATSSGARTPPDAPPSSSASTSKAPTGTSGAVKAKAPAASAAPSSSSSSAHAAPPAAFAAAVPAVEALTAESLAEGIEKFVEDCTAGVHSRPFASRGTTASLAIPGLLLDGSVYHGGVPEAKAGAPGPPLASSGGWLVADASRVAISNPAFEAGLAPLLDTIARDFLVSRRPSMRLLQMVAAVPPLSKSGAGRGGSGAAAAAAAPARLRVAPSAAAIASSASALWWSNRWGTLVLALPSSSAGGGGGAPAVARHGTGIVEAPVPLPGGFEASWLASYSECTLELIPPQLLGGGGGGERGGQVFLVFALLGGVSLAGDGGRLKAPAPALSPADVQRALETLLLRWQASEPGLNGVPKRLILGLDDEGEGASDASFNRALLSIIGRAVDRVPRANAYTVRTVLSETRTVHLTHHNACSTARYRVWCSHAEGGRPALHACCNGEGCQECFKCFEACTEAHSVEEYVDAAEGFDCFPPWAESSCAISRWRTLDGSQAFANPQEFAMPASMARLVATDATVGRSFCRPLSWRDDDGEGAFIEHVSFRAPNSRIPCRAGQARLGRSHTSRAIVLIADESPWEVLCLQKGLSVAASHAAAKVRDGNLSGARAADASRALNTIADEVLRSGASLGPAAEVAGAAAAIPPEAALNRVRASAFRDLMILAFVEIGAPLSAEQASFAEKHFSVLFDFPSMLGSALGSILCTDPFWELTESQLRVALVTRSWREYDKMRMNPRTVLQVFEAARASLPPSTQLEVERAKIRRRGILFLARRWPIISIECSLDAIDVLHFLLTDAPDRVDAFVARAKRALAHSAPDASHTRRSQAGAAAIYRALQTIGPERAELIIGTLLDEAFLDFEASACVLASEVASAFLFDGDAISAAANATARRLLDAIASSWAKGIKPKIGHADSKWLLTSGAREISTHLLRVAAAAAHAPTVIAAVDMMSGEALVEALTAQMSPSSSPPSLAGSLLLSAAASCGVSASLFATSLARRVVTLRLACRADADPFVGVVEWAIRTLPPATSNSIAARRAAVDLAWSLRAALEHLYSGERVKPPMLSAPQLATACCVFLRASAYARATDGGERVLFGLTTAKVGVSTVIQALGLVAADPARAKLLAGAPPSTKVALASFLQPTFNEELRSYRLLPLEEARETPGLCDCEGGGAHDCAAARSTLLRIISDHDLSQASIYVKKLRDVEHMRQNLAAIQTLSGAGAFAWGNEDNGRVHTQKFFLRKAYSQQQSALLTTLTREERRAHAGPALVAFASAPSTWTGTLAAAAAAAAAAGGAGLGHGAGALGGTASQAGAGSGSKRQRQVAAAIELPGVKRAAIIDGAL